MLNKENFDKKKNSNIFHRNLSVDELELLSTFFLKYSKKI